MQVRRVVTLGDDEVDPLGTGELDVGPCRVEMGVARHDLTGASDHREEDPLGGAALVGGYHMAKREAALCTVSRKMNHEGEPA